MFATLEATQQDRHDSSEQRLACMRIYIGAIRATMIADELPLEDAGGEEDRERTVCLASPFHSFVTTAGLRHPQLPDAQRRAARIERCLHKKCSVHRAARALQDSKPADTRDPEVRDSLHAAHPVAAPAAPREAAEPALQLTRELLQEVVGIVSSQYRGTAAGPSGWTFDMICAACQSSDAALDVTLELVNLILSGELPREAFLLDGLLIGL